MAARVYSVPIPEELDQQVKRDMEEEGFNSISEYVREAIRAKLAHSTRRRLEAQLLEAVERGDYREAGPEFWTELRAVARGKPRDD